MIGSDSDFDRWERMPEWESASLWFEDRILDGNMARAAALMLLALVAGGIVWFFVLA